MENSSRSFKNKCTVVYSHPQPVTTTAKDFAPQIEMMKYR